MTYIHLDYDKRHKIDVSNLRWMQTLINGEYSEVMKLLRDKKYEFDYGSPYGDDIYSVYKTIFSRYMLLDLHKRLNNNQLKRLSEVTVDMTRYLDEKLHSSRIDVYDTMTLKEAMLDKTNKQYLHHCDNVVDFIGSVISDEQRVKLKELNLTANENRLCDILDIYCRRLHNKEKFNSVIDKYIRAMTVFRKMDYDNTHENIRQDILEQRDVAKNKLRKLIMKAYYTMPWVYITKEVAKILDDLKLPYVEHKVNDHGNMIHYSRSGKRYSTLVHLLQYQSTSIARCLNCKIIYTNSDNIYNVKSVYGNNDTNCEFLIFEHALLWVLINNNHINKIICADIARKLFQLFFEDYEYELKKEQDCIKILEKVCEQDEDDKTPITKLNHDTMSLIIDKIKAM